MKEPVGVIHGRFQPLHWGHMEYLLAGGALCDILIVGITNPDPWHFGHESTNLARGEIHANPCTFYERYLMVEGALVDAGLNRDEFRIVPFPHSYPERLRYYAPAAALYLLSIYDDWGNAKLDRFQKLELRTQVLWRRTRKVISGTEVRELIRTNGNWRQRVPSAVARVITEFRIEERIRRLSTEGEKERKVP